MELNIQEIASAKIQELHDSGEIKRRIEEGITKTAFNAIDNIVCGWGVSQDLRTAIEKQLNTVVSKINLDSYTKLISKEINKRIDSHLKNEVADKMKEDFDNIFLKKRDQIKISELFDEFKEWYRNENSFDPPVKFDIEQVNDGSFIKYKLGCESKFTRRQHNDTLEFSIFIPNRFNNEDNDDAESSVHGTLSWLYLNGDMFENIKIGRISDLEALLYNLKLNKTQIEIDIDASDYDTYLQEDY